jgi:uncharacterized delta-60 repeat protein
VRARLASVSGGVALAALLATASVAGARSEAGHLDRSFGRDGLVRTQFDAGNSGAQSVAIGRKHRIVVAGRAGEAFGLARYKPNGKLDHSFSRDGTVETGFLGSAQAHAVDIGKKGSVVAAGTACQQSGPCDFAVAKYKSNGHLDHSFGDRGSELIDFPGRRRNSASGVAVDSQGRVLIGGTSCRHKGPGDCDFALARLRRNGELDGSFGEGGRVLTQFDDSGTRASAVAKSMAIGPNGDIVLAGSGCLSTQSVDGRCAEGNRQVTLARYRPNGDPDLSFGDGGNTMQRLLRFMIGASAITLDSHDRIVATGYDTVKYWGLARFGADGSLDRSFGDDGGVTTGFHRGGPTPHAVAIDSRARILVAGREVSEWAIARYQANGSLDKRFSHNGKVLKDFGSEHSSCNAMAIDAHDRPVLAGVAKGRFAVARLLG